MLLNLIIYIVILIGLITLLTYLTLRLVKIISPPPKPESNASVSANGDTDNDGAGGTDNDDATAGDTDNDGDPPPGGITIKEYNYVPYEKSNFNLENTEKFGDDYTNEKEIETACDIDDNCIGYLKWYNMTKAMNMFKLKQGNNTTVVSNLIKDDEKSVVFIKSDWV